MLKVSLVAKTLSKGGAASGARNLLRSLREVGLDVTVFDGFQAQKARPIRFIRGLERLSEHLFFDAETHCIRLGPPVFSIKEIYLKHRPDIIQLCDVSGNTIRFSDLSEVPCPVVHRMSDFWPYHGARHYAEIALDPPNVADKLLDRFVFDGNTMPTCRVAPSDWLASRLVGGEVRMIRNAVERTNVQVARNPALGRLRFGFISPLVLDPRKGFQSLPPYLASMAQHSNVPVELHVYGKLHEASLPSFGDVRVFQNSAFKKAELAHVFDSFDVLLCPSVMDNSPNVVTEALAHGIPVVGQIGTGIESYISGNVGGLVD